MQQETRHRFVDAPLDRSCVVHDGNTQFAERMKKRQAERDLLKSAVGNIADKDGVRWTGFEAGDRHPSAAVTELKAAFPQGDNRGRCMALAQGSKQAPTMPVRLVREDRDPCHCRSKDRASNAGSMRPRRKQRPVSSAVTSTRPGLNSIGSIL